MFVGDCIYSMVTASTAMCAYKTHRFGGAPLLYTQAVNPSVGHLHVPRLDVRGAGLTLSDEGFACCVCNFQTGWAAFLLTPCSNTRLAPWMRAAPGVLAGRAYVHTPTCTMSDLSTLPCSPPNCYTPTPLLIKVIVACAEHARSSCQCCINESLLIKYQ